jgi:protein required for attachment to host cells
VAKRAIEASQRGKFAGVVLAAPARLIGLLRQHLEQHAPIAGVIRKDLTKAPDHELAAWLGHVFPASAR